MSKNKKSVPAQAARKPVLAVQALASQGGEITLDDTLVSISTAQTYLQCLHRFAAVTHIPVVALPTGLFIFAKLFYNIFFHLSTTNESYGVSFCSWSCNLQHTFIFVPHLFLLPQIGALYALSEGATGFSSCLDIKTIFILYILRI